MRLHGWRVSTVVAYEKSFDLSSKLGRLLVCIPPPDRSTVVTTELGHDITGLEIATAMRGANWVSGAVWGVERGLALA